MYINEMLTNLITTVECNISSNLPFTITYHNPIAPSRFSELVGSEPSESTPSLSLNISAISHLTISYDANDKQLTITRFDIVTALGSHVSIYPVPYLVREFNYTVGDSNVAMSIGEIIESILNVSVVSNERLYIDNDPSKDTYGITTSYSDGITVITPCVG